MDNKTYFTTVDITLTGIFCALWVVLTLTLGRLSVQLLGLPILHDFAAFFTLLLITWITGKFGTASLVGLVGSILVLLAGGPLPVVGFAVSAIVFDLLMAANHHRIYRKMYNMVVASLVTAISAYFAGVTVGIFVMSQTVEWMLTLWGGWHLTGGILSIATTLPLICILEKTNVRKVKIVS
jgi:hypothetical protein